MAASVGIPDSTIQILGRWSSDAYRRYLRLSDNMIMLMSRSLASGCHVRRIWDTDLFRSFLKN